MMSILGALFGFTVVLLIGIPLALLTIAIAPARHVFILLTDLANMLLGGFFIVYLFAVLSSITFAAFGELVTLRASSFRARWAWLWLFSFVYVGGTIAYLLLGAPTLLHFHRIALVGQLGTDVAGPLAFVWLILLFSVSTHFFTVLVGYIAASVLAPPHDQYVFSDGEMFVRGLLIGFNAGMNLLLGASAIGAVLAVYFNIVGVVIGIGAGIILAVVSLLPAGMPTGSEDANAAIKRIVGWMSWMMPTSWLATSLGWALYVISATFSVLLCWIPAYGLYLINAVLIEWPYGTLFIEGGIGSNLFPQGPMHSRGAYNLGLFGFVHADTVPEVDPVTGTVTAVGLGRDLIFHAPTRKHESGHNLNLTAFGSFFHLIGAIDENVGPFARHGNAYAERLADSNAPGPTGSLPDPQTPLPFWNI